MKNNKSKEKDEVKILKKSAKAASNKARRESKALGLNIVYLSNNEIIEELPSGEKRVIKKLEIVDSNKTKGLKKGDILCPK